MMMNAQNGDAMRAMAQQFGLERKPGRTGDGGADAGVFNRPEAQRLNARGHVGLPLRTRQRQPRPVFRQHAERRCTPQGVADGNGILGHLFGSKEVSRAVAKQAEAATGIGQEILKQMLPVIASTLMGGLFKQSTGQMQGTVHRAAANPIGDLISEMMRQGLGGEPRRTRDPAGLADGQPAGPDPSGHVRRQSATASHPDAPIRREIRLAAIRSGKIFQDMLGGAHG
jgi:hypothetical protein